MLKDDAGGTQSGKAYIYNTVTGALLHTLDNPNPYGTSQSDALDLSSNIRHLCYRRCSVMKMMLVVLIQVKHTSTTMLLVLLLHTLDNPNAYDTSEMIPLDAQYQ